MRWGSGRRSANVEDRRGMRVSPGMAGGGLELQADCLAGIWAHHADRSRQMLEQGDVEEALNAASQIGDDRMQMRGRGYVAPESFTHGSGEQRVRWFRTGLESGDLSRCDTFDSARS